jgi:hypothetical protein
MQIISWSLESVHGRKEKLACKSGRKFQLVSVDQVDPDLSEYPESKLKLYLEGRIGLDKTSWILCPHYYKLPLGNFETFTTGKKAMPYDRRYEESSYKKLMELFDLPPGEFVATQDLISLG